MLTSFTFRRGLSGLIKKPNHVDTASTFKPDDGNFAIRSSNRLEIV